MTTFDATIKISDDGFFHPRGAIEADFVDANRFHHVGVEALHAPVQFARVAVYMPTDVPPAEHLVVWAHYPRLPDARVAETATALRSAFPDAPVSFVLDVVILRRGDVCDIEIEAWCTDSKAACESVAAVGAAQCFGTLAEVERVTVRLDGTIYSALMRPSAAGWLASVSTPVNEPIDPTQALPAVGR